jgi:hypothetical protein
MIEMDLALNGLKVNAPIEEERRTALFTVPPPPEGSRVTYLDEAAGDASKAGNGRRRAETRNSVPAPEAGAKLGAPAPIGVDEARRKETDPIPLGADLGQTDQLVDMPMPAAPENAAERVSQRDAQGMPK